MLITEIGPKMRIQYDVRRFFFTLAAVDGGRYTDTPRNVR
jgi:hypothetical protein